jgi:3-oxoacyl-[acyl-carrier-protein] synthase-3
MNKVYINKIEKYLPNDPVPNERMEDFLGLVHGNPSKSRNMILRSNRIKTRYYALDEEGNPTHSNAELTAIAIRKLFEDGATKISDIELLVAGTSSPDTIQPSHALMVLGELGSQPMEAVSPSGTCNAGMLALKYAYLAILSGQCKNAVFASSETFSSWMHARNFKDEVDKRSELEENPYIAFEKDFLRWMLSDGAVAALVQDKPNSKGIALQIDWIEIRSYANELETCMYAGCFKDKNGKVKGWRNYSSDQIGDLSVLSLKQDAKLLQKHILQKGSEFLKDVIAKHNFNVEEVDYFLPHLSSMFFRKPSVENMIENGIHIPEEKWFINLEKVGNVGAASASLMIEELMNSGSLNVGEKILLMVPESARFSYTYVLLTVV